jgi:membrane dipeptidase
MATPPRFIDLHCDWLLQYATETTLFDAALYARTAQRLPQAEGYLGATSAAVIACFRRADDWERQPDPWRAVFDLIARIEAEFAGRILMTEADRQRWREDADSLTWAVVGIEGFDTLVRGSEDLGRLPSLVERGVRLLQPIYGASSRLGGSAAAGDERGLTDLGRAFLQTLDGTVRDARGVRVLLDLAHMNPTTMSDVLAWFEAGGARTERMVPVYSHGAVRHDGFPLPRALTRENLARLRNLGGVIGLSVGPPFYRGSDELREGLEAAASLPWRGREGFDGIAIGTDFLGVDETAPGLRNVPEVVAWLSDTFPPPLATALIAGNADALLERLFHP